MRISDRSSDVCSSDLLRVEGSTGAYGFRLIDVAAAIPFTPGSALVSGVLEPGRSTDIFSFAGEAGQKLYFDARTTLNSGGVMRIVDPFGRLVTGPTSLFDRELTLPATGTYLRFIEGKANRDAASDDYAFFQNGRAACREEGGQ